ncbi:MAG TPA: hypothetical protein PL033_02115 [Candidatus Brocadiia bacterium]|nr:hypothetical protein [Candidatus Brocadiia bacterium]
MSKDAEPGFALRFGRVIAPLVIYFIVACALFPGLIQNLDTHILSDDIFILDDKGIRYGDSDAFNSLWSYWWVQKAVRNFKNPFFCDWVYPPQGVNIFFHNQVLLPTILTLPVSIALGTVAGYNLMVLLLLSSAAWVFFLFCRFGMRLSVAASAAGGAFFGFSAYFMRTAHAHPNMLGGVFWGGALACLSVALFRTDMRRRLSIPFALCFWATYWTSFGEFFMLAWAIGIAVLFRLFSDRANLSAEIRSLGAFLIPVAIGSVSLLSLLASPPSESLARPVVIRLSLKQLFMPSNITLPGGFIPPMFGELDRCYLPVSLLVLAMIGRALSSERAFINWSLAVALTLLVFTFDPWGIPSSVYRSMPMGSGMRFPSRFLPFALFFMSIPAAQGVGFLLAATSRRSSRRKFAIPSMIVLTIVFIIETWPINSHVTSIRRPPVPAAILATIDRSRPLWILFKDERVINDSYQVFFDMPCTEVSHLARGGEMIDQWARSHPIMYALNSISPEPGVVTRDMVLAQADALRRQLDAELSDAGVRYIFTEDPALFYRLPVRGVVLWEGHTGTLGAITDRKDIGGH